MPLSYLLLTTTTTITYPIHYVKRFLCDRVLGAVKERPRKAFFAVRGLSLLCQRPVTDTAALHRAVQDRVKGSPRKNLTASIADGMTAKTTDNGCAS